MIVEGVPKPKMDGKDPKPFANNVIFVLDQVVDASATVAQQASIITYSVIVKHNPDPP